ncbi:MAG: hypothetical protein L6Q98_24950 [Anaerolineae bacterium]|nr:hypothetical protein [Anaerolineae bacterium]NUQ07125.1 hypothetical protein [Anaerolineae bacterium]
MPSMGPVDLKEYDALRIRVMELEAQVAFLMKHLNLTYQPPADDFEEKLREMVRQGKAIEAIKLYVQKTGASLEEAKRHLTG